MSFRTWLEQFGSYAYRGIDMEQFPSIQQHGLHPNWDMRKSAEKPEDLHALSNDPDIDPNKLYLYFSDKEDLAGEYGTVLRFPKPKDAVPHTQHGYFLTTQPIPPQNIEVQVHYTDEYVPILKARLNPDGTVKG